MPLGDAGIFSTTFGFVDNNRKRASTGIYLPGTLTIPQGDTRITEIAAAMAALSNAGLDTAAHTLLFDDPAIVPDNLDPSSEVERKLVLIFGTANRFVKVRMEIPSPVFSVEQDGTDEVSTSQPLVAALADVLINGSLGPGNGIRSGGGQDVTVLERAFIAHRNRRARG